jgi:hypothetical protein
MLLLHVKHRTNQYSKIDFEERNTTLYDDDKKDSFQSTQWQKISALTGKLISNYIKITENFKYISYNYTHCVNVLYSRELTLLLSNWLTDIFMDYIFIFAASWIALELISNIALKQSTFKVIFN